MFLLENTYHGDGVPLEPPFSIIMFPQTLDVLSLSHKSFFKKYFSQVRSYIDRCTIRL
jgi:hypothetical protein